MALLGSRPVTRSISGRGLQHAPPSGARRPVRARGPRWTAAAAAGDASDPVAVIKDCVATPNAHPAPELLSAMLALEKAQALADDWPDIISNPRVQWRLIFTADSKNVVAAQKKQANKGGIYFPIPACQKFAGGVFTNGVFLGPLGYLTFDGPYHVAAKRQLTFDVRRMTLGLGPWKVSFPLTQNQQALGDMDDKARKALPFFLYCYSDRDILVGRGRGGGLAVWARATPEWCLQTGVAAVYK